MKKDEIFMSRCIQLAKNGKTHAQPNPMVGAVIVHNGRIIGEGYHIRCGGPHAEVNAIRSVKRPELLKESTIYVSLEPCSHFGKTPPCADLIIEKQIPRVVIGCQDPFSKVAGRGIKKLIDAGIDVKVGVLENECLALNKTFMKYNTSHRPYICLKWAQSTDGYIDINRTTGAPVILSSPLSQMRVHKLRTEHRAILVGRNTVLLDNPSLTSRFWYGENPIRCVIDHEGKIPEDSHILDGMIQTYVYTALPHDNRANVTYVTIDRTRDLLSQILEHLYTIQVQSLLVEGGAQTLQSFIDADLWDEAHIEKTSLVLNNGIKAPNLNHGTRYHCNIQEDATIEIFKNKN